MASMLVCDSTRGGVYSRNPVAVDVRERLTGIFTDLSLERTDKDTVRGEEICDGSSFCEELRVGEDIEAAIGLGVGLEDSAHRLSCAAWNSRFLNDDLVRGGNSGDAAGCELDVARKWNFIRRNK